MAAPRRILPVPVPAPVSMPMFVPSPDIVVGLLGHPALPPPSSRDKKRKRKLTPKAAAAAAAAADAIAKARKTTKGVPVFDPVDLDDFEEVHIEWVNVCEGKDVCKGKCVCKGKYVHEKWLEYLARMQKFANDLKLRPDEGLTAEEPHELRIANTNQEPGKQSSSCVDSSVMPNPELEMPWTLDVQLAADAATDVATDVATDMATDVYVEVDANAEVDAEILSELQCALEELDEEESQRELKPDEEMSRSALEALDVEEFLLRASAELDPEILEALQAVGHCDW